jgi:predicted ATPase
LHTIDSAIATARRSGESYFLSPLLRRRAEILAQCPGPDQAMVTAALREACAVAEAQGADLFARQAAARLAGEMSIDGPTPIAASFS